MELIGIYKITSPSNKVYIGQSANIQRRFNEYKIKHCKKQQKLYNSFYKYGVDAHKFEILIICDFDKLNYYERYYQELYNSVENGLNLIYTKTDIRPIKISDETKRKMSESAKLKTFTKEHKENISIAKKGNKGPKGHIRSLETKLKMSISKKGIIFSDETRKKMSIAQTGKKLSIETKIKQSKAVLQYDLDGNFISEYYSIIEASRVVGGSHSNISKCCNGKYKSSVGYIWKYKTKQ